MEHWACCEQSTAWVPNLMFLSRFGSFLLFEWLIIIFDHFTHSRYANFTAVLLFKPTCIPPWVTYGFVTFN